MLPEVLRLQNAVPPPPTLFRDEVEPGDVLSLLSLSPKLFVTGFIDESIGDVNRW